MSMVIIIRWTSCFWQEISFTKTVPHEDVFTKSWLSSVNIPWATNQSKLNYSVIQTKEKRTDIR